MEVRMNDFGYDLVFNIKKAGGLVVEDLTGVTSAKLQVATVDNSRNIVDGSCVITDAPNGVITYTVLSTDFTKEGTYKAVIKLITGTTKVLSTLEFYISVLRKLGKS